MQIKAQTDAVSWLCYVYFSLLWVDEFIVALMMFGWCLSGDKVAGCPKCCNWSRMRWEPPGLGEERDLAGTASHLLMSLASGILHVFSREAQSSPACCKTNLLQMKMTCLLLSRSHLNGSVSLDIICCVHSLFWACTDGDLHGHHFQKCRLPQTRCSSFLLWDPVLFFLFLTLETKLLQTLSSEMQLCSLLSSDTHPANISAANGAEPSQ